MEVPIAPNEVVPQRYVKIIDNWYVDTRCDIARIYFGDAKSITTPDKATGVSMKALLGSKVEEITFSDSIEVIYGTSQINDKKSCLKRVNFGKGLLTICDYAFQYSSLSKVVIPDNVKEIRAYSFYNCVLEEVVLSKSLSVIPEFAFGRNLLTKIVIPPNVKKLDLGCFSRNKLEKVVLSEGLKQIGLHCFEYNEIREIVIPSTVNSIGDNAFFGNRLKKVVIPDNVTSIGSNAFNCNPLEEVSLPAAALITIGSDAFPETLRKVTIRGKVGLFAKFRLRSFFEKGIQLEFVSDKKEEIDSSKEKQNEVASVTDDLEAEIKSLLSRINDLIEPMRDDKEKEIRDTVEALLQKYRKNIDALKPNFNINASIKLESQSSYEGLHTNLIAALNKIILVINNMRKLRAILEETNEYESQLNDLKDIEIPNDISDIKGKIKFMIALSKKYNLPNVTKELHDLFDGLNVKISEKLIESVNGAVELSSQDEEEVLLDSFSREIDHLFDSCYKYNYIKESLVGKNEDNLSQIMCTLKSLLLGFDMENQIVFEKRIEPVYGLIQFSDCQQEDLSVLLGKIASFLEPILKNIQEVAPCLTSCKDIFDDLNMALDDNIDRETKEKMAIASVALEIEDMAANEIISNELFEKISQMLKSVLKSSKDKLVETIKRENYNMDVLKDIDDKIRDEVLKKLYEIKSAVATYIERKKEYEENKFEI